MSLSRALMHPAPTVTLGASAGATQIASSALVSSRSGAALGGPYRYVGANVVPLGTSWPDSQYVGIVSGTVPSVFRAQFTTDADAFEVFMKGTAGAFRVSADGLLATASSSSAGAADGQPYLHLIEFGSAATREIELELVGAFGGVRVGPGFTVTAPTSELPATRCVMIGDSFTDGTGATSKIMSLPYVLGWRRGWEMLASGRGGTGYITPGAFSTFRDRLAADVIAYSPDVVIVAGGLNDAEAGLAAEAALLFAAIRAGLPATRLIVVSPWAPRSIDVAAKTAILAAAASATGAQFIDVTGWLTGTGDAGTPNGTGNSDINVGPDHTHPPQAGHDYLGVRLDHAISPPSTGLAL